MKIGLFYVGDIPAYARLGQLAAEVAKLAMPECDIVHLTDTNTQELVGVDYALRMEKKSRLAVFRMQHHQVPGEWLFIDVDVLIHRPVREIFRDSFDIAIADRSGYSFTGIFEKTGEKLEDMPYNMGVVFSRSPEFWHAVEAEMQPYDDKWREWMGDQLAVNRLIARGEFDVKILPGATYNYAPDKKTGDPKNAAIVHYKGPRKHYMVEQAFRLLHGAHLSGTEALSSIPA